MVWALVPQVSTNSHDDPGFSTIPAARAPVPTNRVHGFDSGGHRCEVTRQILPVALRWSPIIEFQMTNTQLILLTSGSSELREKIVKDGREAKLVENA
jgi:hypothetical protein